MFGNRRDVGGGDQRVLVAAAEPVHEDGDGGDDQDLNLNGGSHMTYHDVLSFARRKKYMLVFAGTGIILFLALIIGTICATAGHHGPSPSPTPAPITSTTTGTTTTTTTSTTTTTEKTTTTPTTTTPTTTTTTTEKTTTTPTTTTTSTTTTTTPKTTTTPTTTTIRPPTPPAPTAQPLPPHPENLPATSLIYQVFNRSQLNFSEVNCVEDKHHPLVYKYILTIEGVVGNFTGLSNSKKHAVEGASRLAAESMFGVKYEKAKPIPPPPQPCIENGTSLLNFPSEDTHVPSLNSAPVVQN